MAASTIDVPAPERPRAIRGADPGWYRVLLRDHDDRVYFVFVLHCASDVEAEIAAERMHVPFIGGGFELWQGDRLVHRCRR